VNPQEFTHENRTGRRFAIESIALLVNVAEVTLAKQADLLLCGSVNTGTISKRVF
jgi:hypothetical protein